jgi:tetratricopeptide (TPR) repeat protein
MSSALELYKEAYDLDFNKGESLFAERLYKDIIERYPNSDEKEYAQVHLERIAKLKGNPNDPAYAPLKSGRSGGGLAMACFVLLLLLLMTMGFGFYYGYRQYLRMDSLELVLDGLLCEKNGNTSGATENYNLAQHTYPQNGVAYRCLAELYLRAGKLTQADLVGKQWELLLPDDVNIADFKKRLADVAKQGAKP